MRENCSICNLNYNPEPGFYFGAMFISYIITAWVYVILAGIVMYFFDFSVDEAIWTVVIFAALTFVYFFRLGRSVWLAINVKYKDNAGDNKNPQNHIK